MDEPLAPRQQAILEALVREYIRTGEPVGSKNLVEREGIEVSSATVRNEMARLEEMSYVVQPHTSAGRIPTDLGFRFFVDNIEPPVRLPRRDERAIEAEMSREPESLEELLMRATDLIARLTRCAAAILAPQLAPSRLRHIDLVSLAARRALVVVVAANGRVEERIVAFDREVGQSDLDRIGEELNRSLAGRTLDKASEIVAGQAAAASPLDATILTSAAEALGQTARAEGKVVVGGASNLAEEHTFERDTITDLWRALEHQTELLSLLAQRGEPAAPHVRIGAELPVPSMRSCSLVSASYGTGEASLGTVGIIGPTRMDYRRAIAAAAAVARSLESALGHVTR